MPLYCRTTDGDAIWDFCFKVNAALGDFASKCNRLRLLDNLFIEDADLYDGVHFERNAELYIKSKYKLPF